MNKLWHKILCFFGIHGWSGLVYIDCCEYRDGATVSNLIGGTFTERIAGRWYRVWAHHCPWCRHLSPCVESDIPIEMRDL